jgi:hypothetical protein
MPLCTSLRLCCGDIRDISLFIESKERPDDKVGPHCLVHYHIQALRDAWHVVATQ